MTDHAYYENMCKKAADSVDEVISQLKVARHAIDGYDKMLADNGRSIGELTKENFDLKAKICELEKSSLTQLEQLRESWKERDKLNVELGYFRNNSREKLEAKIKELKATIESYQRAARMVVRSWETGDLAGAVRNLDAQVNGL